MHRRYSSPLGEGPVFVNSLACMWCYMQWEKPGAEVKD